MYMEIRMTNALEKIVKLWEKGAYSVNITSIKQVGLAVFGNYIVEYNLTFCYIDSGTLKVNVLTIPQKELITTDDVEAIEKLVIAETKFLFTTDRAVFRLIRREQIKVYNSLAEAYRATKEEYGYKTNQLKFIIDRKGDKTCTYGEFEYHKSMLAGV